MEILRFSAGHVANRSAARDRPFGSSEAAILGAAGLAAARNEITSWPDYRPTPLVPLPGLARRLGLGQILYKDEDKRFRVAQFQGTRRRLRCAHGLAGTSGREWTACRLLPCGELLDDGRHRALTAGLTVTCATDGNHGRSVAWGAQMFGCRCRIYLHAHVSAAREHEIARYGARIHRVPGTYDDSVRDCARDAAKNGWILVADTADDAGARIPALVMHGYSVMTDEILAQPGGKESTHVFVQGGVGGLAAAVAGHLWQTMGARRPRCVVVEPSRADCIARSVAAGRPTPVPGTLDTFMACLAAGEVSRPAWTILEHAVDDVLTLPEEAAPATMRLLATGTDGDPPLVSGESGCAATAGLVAAALDPVIGRALGLSGDARVIVIGSEGATDPVTYRRVVGRAGNDMGAS